MSAILDTIIARGFNLNQPEFGNNFVQAQNRRQLLDNGMENDALYRQAQQFELNQAQQAAADQQAVGSALAQYQSAPQEVLTAADQALANFDASAARGGVNPALRDKAVEILNSRGMGEVGDRQAKAAQLVLQRSPGAQEAVATQMFAQPELEVQDPLSSVGKMIADLDRLPLNHPQRGALEQAIQGALQTDSNGIPADVQTAQWFMNASPEARDAFILTKRAFDPQGAYSRGEYDPSGYENSRAAGKEKGKLTTQAENELHGAILPMRRSLSGLYRIREIVANSPQTGPIIGQTQAQFSSEVQALRAMLKDELFSKVSSARAAGATFGSMTEGEWRNLEQTIASLENYQGANLSILDSQIAKIETQLAESNSILSNKQQGEWLPLPQDAPQAYPTAPKQQSTESVNYEDLP